MTVGPTGEDYEATMAALAAAQPAFRTDGYGVRGPTPELGRSVQNIEGADGGFGRMQIREGPAGSAGGGERGGRGQQGAAGAPGGVGATGPTGASPGPTGPQGAQGNDGQPGARGPTGAPGGIGPTGPPGDSAKEAIVPTSLGPRALFCTEAPEVWFFDVIRMKCEGHSRASIDPLFLEVCEPDSVRIISTVSDYPAALGSFVQNGIVIVSASSHVALSITVLIAGIRRGFAGVRFPERTTKQMQLNNERWRHLAGE